MAHAAIPTLQEGITDGVLALLSPETQPEGKELGDSAADLVDEYLTQGASDNSVEKEPTWSGNLNQFLKSEKVGHIGSTPKLRQLIGDYGRLLSRGTRGEVAPKDRIVAKLKAGAKTASESE